MLTIFCFLFSSLSFSFLNWTFRVECGLISSEHVSSSSSPCRAFWFNFFSSALSDSHSPFLFSASPVAGSYSNVFDICSQTCWVLVKYIVLVGRISFLKLHTGIMLCVNSVLFLFSFNSFFFFNLFIYFWLCWVFVSVRGLSPVAASGGPSLSQCTGLSLSQPLLLRSTGSRRAGSVVVAHGPSCFTACGIFPDWGSNPCPLHWQADS